MNSVYKCASFKMLFLSHAKMHILFTEVFQSQYHIVYTHFMYHMIQNAEAGPGCSEISPNTLWVWYSDSDYLCLGFACRNGTNWQKTAGILKYRCASHTHVQQTGYDHTWQEAKLMNGHMSLQVLPRTATLIPFMKQQSLFTYRLAFLIWPRISVHTVLGQSVICQPSTETQGINCSAEG